jgi:hypothetical protein
MEPQFVVHGEVFRRLWDGPFQVVDIHSVGYRCNLKRCQ